MAIVVGTGVALSLTTGSKSAEQITGDNQYVGRGRIQLVCKQTGIAATGIRVTLTVGGVPLINDQIVPFGGTAGTLSMADNMLLDQMVAGGRVGLTFRNDSAGTLTVDYQVLFTPGK